MHPLSLILYGLALGGTRPLLTCLLGTALLVLPFVLLKGQYYRAVEVQTDLTQPWEPIQEQDSNMAVTDQAEREALLAAIYDATPLPEIREALRRYGIRYILFDRRRPDGVGSPAFAEKFTDREGDGRVAYADVEYLLIEFPP